MKHYKILLLIILLSLVSCSKDVKKQLLEVTDKITDKIETISESTAETVNEYKQSIVDKITTTENASENAKTVNDSIAATQEIENQKFLGITTFKKFISDCKTGETITQKELI